MHKTPKTDALFAEVEKLYPTQLYHRGDYVAKVRALYGLMFTTSSYSTLKGLYAMLCVTNILADHGGPSKKALDILKQLGL